MKNSLLKIFKNKVCKGCGSKEIIYLGSCKHSKQTIFGYHEWNGYVYVCSSCGRISETKYREKCKHKWCKYNLKQLDKILGGEGTNRLLIEKTYIYEN